MEGVIVTSSVDTMEAPGGEIVVRVHSTNINARIALGEKGGID